MTFGKNGKTKIKSRKEDYPMAEELFMRVSEVAEAMGVSESYAYKIIRQLNKELKKTGCITLNGRIDRKFFYNSFYSTRENDERK